MRIIAGRAKAKRLVSPKTEKTRPTLDRVKEAMFSIINNYIKDADVLDLFGGTGNLALESISRGAKFAWINDKDSFSISTILSNAKLTNSLDCVKITKKDYAKCLNQIAKENMLFDVIFIDPPYDSNLAIDTLDKISESENLYLKEDGIIIYETDKNFLLKLEKNNKAEILNSFKNLQCIDERAYGNVVLKLYKWR
ncbi:MAG: 16S rRNA (guanine(966)-N(2))-methyltransferase RsmD [Clostridia bacterium]|nr:16S rRNA (guanine(966)-N(2))-methyltransferase RsmD [Clostridia bacterium]MBQ8379294.1 16S rRNA (guanine(966)-N(2))-methyltransferase RsmD [Clostridia bacterium]